MTRSVVVAREALDLRLWEFDSLRVNQGEAMRILLKVLNPLIWCVNMLMYFSHLETYRHASEYESYDFSKDIRYF